MLINPTSNQHRPVFWTLQNPCQDGRTIGNLFVPMKSSLTDVPLQASFSCLRRCDIAAAAAAAAAAGLFHLPAPRSGLAVAPGTAVMLRLDLQTA
ncbi:hypothetical protein HDV57DRAFT_286545 [Trichoderma longibrachiatum]